MKKVTKTKKELTEELAQMSQMVSDLETWVNERKLADRVLRESEENYRDLFDNAHDLVQSVDPDGKYVYVNNAWLQTLGYNKEEVKNLKFSDVISEDELDHCLELFKQVGCGKEVDNIQTVFNTKDGRKVFVEGNIGARMVEGRLVSTRAIFRDISERKRADEALQLQRVLFEQLFEGSLDAIAMIDTEDRVILANHAFESIFGFSPEEIQGCSLNDVIVPPDFHTEGMRLSRQALDGESIRIETTRQRKDGSIVDVEILGYPTFIANETAGAYVVYRDISERRCAQKELQESDEKHRSLIENLNEIVYTVDENAVVTYISPNIEHIGGYHQSEVIGKKFTDFVYPEDLPGRIEQFQEIISGNAEVSEYRLLTKDGHPRWMRMNSRPIIKDDRVAGLQGVLVDITERKIAEDEILVHTYELEALNDELIHTQQQLIDTNLKLGDSEAELSAIFDSAPIMMILVDEDRRIIKANQTTMENTGHSHEEIVGLRGGEALGCIHTINDSGKCEVGIACHNCIGRNIVLDTFKTGKAHYRIKAPITIDRGDGPTALCMNVSTTPLHVEDRNFVLVSMEDITERIQAEEEIREQSKFLNTILESLTHPFYVINANDYTITLGNTAALGSPKQEFSTCYPITHHEDKPCQSEQHPCPIEIIKETKQPTTVQHIHYDKDGIPATVEVHAYPIFDNEGNVTQIIEYSIDITERKRAEEILWESYYIINNSPAVIFLWKNEEGWPVEYVSENVVEVFGHSAEDLTSGKVPYATVVHPEDLERVGMEVSTHSEDPDRIEFTQEYRIITKDDQIRWIDDRTYIRRDSQGNITHYQGIILDITERKRADEALRKSEEKLRTIFENANDEIIYLDESGVIIDVNRKVQDIFGWTPEEAIGRNFTEFAFVAPEYMGDLFEGVVAAIREEKTELMAFEAIRKDGCRAFVEANVRLVEREEGTKHLLIIIRDITERKQAEEAAFRARELEEIDRLRNALLASVSHELRTPLTVIKGLSETLAQTEVEWDSETQRDFLNTISYESDSLTHVIENLEKMSMLEAGITIMNKTPCKISVLIGRLTGKLRTITDNRHLEVNISPDLPIVDADENHISIVLANLVTNAVLYSEEGTLVTLEATSGDGEITVSITDQGIGIPSDQLDKVFDRFHRLESGVAHRRGGTGLGLPISKWIIEAHGGRIWAESEEGKGSKFSFSLPVTDNSW